MSETNPYVFLNSEEFEKELWNNCIFVFDSSALLDLYALMGESQAAIFNQIFPKINDRLWIPAQVNLEYQRNRIETLKKPFGEKYGNLDKDYLNPIREAFSVIKPKVTGLIQNTNKLESKTKSASHPYFDEALIKQLEQLKDNCDSFNTIDSYIKKTLEVRQDEIFSYEQDDSVQENIVKFFKVGKEYSYNELMAIVHEGKVRYSHEIAPGYKDAVGQNAKEGINVYGDLILWKQIIEFAKMTQKPIVFVSNDTKDDWCYLIKKDKARVERPKEELIMEIWDVAGVRFWMYHLEQFIHLANKKLDANVPQDVINDVKAVSEKPLSPKFAVIDQENTYWDNYAFTISDETPFLAQIYQAGITGRLIAVGLNITLEHFSLSRPIGLTVSIYSVKDGIPNRPLGNITYHDFRIINLGEMVPLQLIYFSQPIQQEQGEKYAIAITFIDIQNVRKHIMSFRLGGNTGFYSNGYTCFSCDGIIWSQYNDSSVYFRTIVIPD